MCAGRVSGCSHGDTTMDILQPPHCSTAILFSAGWVIRPGTILLVPDSDKAHGHVTSLFFSVVLKETYTPASGLR